MNLLADRLKTLYHGVRREQIMKLHIKHFLKLPITSSFLGSNIPDNTSFPDILSPKGCTRIWNGVGLQTGKIEKNNFSSLLLFVPPALMNIWI